MICTNCIVGVIIKAFACESVNAFCNITPKIFCEIAFFLLCCKIVITYSR